MRRSNAAALLLLSAVWATPQDVSAQIASQLERCEAGIAAGCYEVAQVPVPETVPGIEEAARLALAACERGEVGHCRVALAIAASSDDPAPAAVTSALERACAATDGRACLLLSFATTAPDTSIDDRLRLIERGCSLRDHDACVARALLRRDAPGGGRAAMWAELEQTCTAGAAHGCLLVGQRHAGGIDTTPDLPRSLTFFARGCELGSLESCAMRGRTLLSIGGARGSAMPAAERDAAVAMLVDACDRGSAEACTEAGVVLSGEDEVIVAAGVARDARRSSWMFERACNGGDGQGCLQLGVEHERAEPANFEGAVEAYRRGCEIRDGRACSYLADFLAIGRGAPMQLERAFLAWGAACELGYDEACPRVYRWMTVVRAYGGGRPTTEADGVARAQRACDGGNPRACTVLAARLLTGRGVARSPSRAVPLLQRSCDRGHAEACAMLGALLRAGGPVRRDDARATTLLDWSCAHGVRWACTPRTLIQSRR